MATSEGSATSSSGKRSLARSAQVIVIGSVMFTFISYWRTAAVVLCDLGSTAYYIGGIVEQAIGPAAPWFILAVMLFSYCVRWVYIESCTLFIRGGVYRVVREALGPNLAKLSVSALIFDYLLTGPISGVSAGQYIVGLAVDTLKIFYPSLYANMGFAEEANRIQFRSWGAVLFAIAITLYFFRQNLLGMHESSGKALNIMRITTVMVVVVLIWSGITLALRPRDQLNRIPLAPDLTPKVEYSSAPGLDPITRELKELWRKHPETGQLVADKDEKGRDKPKVNALTGRQEDPLGFLPHILPTSWTESLRHPSNWFNLIGLFGICLAFGHSILAMSGEETLAQVYREVESPKLKNFKKAAFIVFLYSLIFTAGISFLAVLLIPDEIRMKEYADNLISGLAMHLAGPAALLLLLSGFVVLVGFLILAGAVNTAIIGSNGVLNRVAEDGVMPDWFLKPHHRYGTTYRILYLIVGLQILIILGSGGNTLLLGEAYAFGVVWSFVFKALAMVVLRFKDRRPREFMVPLNIRVGQVQVPIGLSLILLVLLIVALINLLTKEVATLSGLTFTALFFLTFHYSERLHHKKRRGARHEHLEQFNQKVTGEITPENLDLHKHYRKLIAIRSTQNLFMLEKALAETDPETTGMVVMTAKVAPEGEDPKPEVDLDAYDQQLMTAVVQRAETAGKQVKPLIVPTNNPLYAVLRTAKDLKAQELIVGASNKFTAEEQLEQMAFYWFNLHEGQPTPLTIRILGRDRDVHLDLEGGNRIPKISERRARSVAELRAAGVGVDRVLMAHDGSPETSDLFQAVLTMLDPEVVLAIVPIIPPGKDLTDGPGVVLADRERAKQVDRELIELQPAPDKDLAQEIIRLAREGKYDLIVVNMSPVPSEEYKARLNVEELVANSPCRIFQAWPPAMPKEPEGPG